ncbi:MAG: hypothetical protein E6J59_17795 [Deltaproteobacteria bacterium]|nr:MAG: hypothetical protein E6J59_17795 [Deltaproteobacteria bacterium]
MRGGAAAIAVLVAACAGVPGARAETFREILERPITRPVGDALADSIGHALPITAASAGVTFSFNKATHAWERETDILGQLYLERPRPLGRGKLNLSVSYQWMRIDTVDGQDLDRLSDTRFPIVSPGNGRLFTVPRFGLDLDTHQVTTSVTYGATDDLDLNLTIPVLYSRFALNGILRDVADRHEQRARVRSSKLGPGDVFLRAKYRLVHGAWGDLAAGLVLRAPAGNQDNFQGTGTWEPAPMLYAATPSLSLGYGVGLQAYANGGVELNGDDVDRSAGRFGFGLDCAVKERFTAAVAVLGREPFQGIAPPGFFDVARVDPSTGRRFMAPVLGLERDRASTYDLSLGGRMNLWHDTVFGFANVILPLNRDGFRSDVIPLAGVEAAF